MSQYISVPQGLHFIQASYQGELLASVQAFAEEAQSLLDSPECKALLVDFSAFNQAYASFSGDKEAFFASYSSLHAQLRALEKHPKALIAYIPERCSAAALDLALLCNYRLALPEAVFQIYSPSEGYPPLGALQRSGRILGLQKAIELWTSSQALSAQEALQLGLLKQLVEEPSALQQILSELLAKQGDAPCLNPWDLKGYKQLYGPSSREGEVALFLANARVVQEQKAQPFTKYILASLHDALDRQIDRALDIDLRYSLLMQSAKQVAE